uniref:Secreted protein n=1 Tax=Trypanosoma vivax (strain Y486) TaxID=1055687 RepID=G0TZV5_TRYVY|nr:hypothetical protein, unlikely [Trypanosoma vivax Y486]
MIWGVDSIFALSFLLCSLARQSESGEGDGSSDHHPTPHVIRWAQAPHTLSIDQMSQYNKLRNHNKLFFYFVLQTNKQKRKEKKRKISEEGREGKGGGGRSRNVSTLFHSSVVTDTNVGRHSAPDLERRDVAPPAPHTPASCLPR